MTLVWFLMIGTLGLVEIVREPRILAAMNPLYAVRFFSAHGFVGFAVLGAVFLAVTGAEALYADIGHFGKKPIRLAFFALVLPALLLNYFGQGALLLRNPDAVEQPVLSARAAVVPLSAARHRDAGGDRRVAGADLGGVFAGTAVRAARLQPAPDDRSHVGARARADLRAGGEQGADGRHAADRARVPVVGRARCRVRHRGDGDDGDHDHAVRGRSRGRVGIGHCGASLDLTAFFFAFDFAFLGANALKIEQGGWVPLLIALVDSHADDDVEARARDPGGDHASFEHAARLAAHGHRSQARSMRVPGTAVFLTSDAEGAPVVLLHHLKHNKVLHKQVVLLSVVSADVPEVEDDERVQVTALEHGFFRVTATLRLHGDA